MLCVHGNPTWSYLWRRFLAAAPPGWRVVAVDQLGMGWSERAGAPRRLADADRRPRRADRGAGHRRARWSPSPTTGAARSPSAGRCAHRDQLAGMVLANTAVHHDPATAAPALIRLARVAERCATWCASAPRPSSVRPRRCPGRPCRARSATGWPRRTTSAAARRAVGDFVADIPLEPDHPSRAALDAVGRGADRALADVPALLLWGARDPVFTERYLDDLSDRLPQADVQRYPRAAHLVTEDVPEAADHVWRWVERARRDGHLGGPGRTRAGSGLAVGGAAGPGRTTRRGGGRAAPRRGPAWSASPSWSSGSRGRGRAAGRRRPARAAGGPAGPAGPRPDRRGVRLLAGRGGDRGRRRRAGAAADCPPRCAAPARTT